MTIALIDGDIVAHRASAAAQKTVDWGDGDGPSVHVSQDGAIEAALQTVNAWAALARCKIPVVCLSSPVNFRKHILPTYKANRKTAKPVAFRPVVEALKAEFKHFTLHGLEADDVMGILATSDRYADSVVVTIDKDLQTVPGRHFNPLKDMRPKQVRPVMADRQWLMQTLTGDSTDGYAGCPGVGPVNAERILAEAGLNTGAMWAAVVAAFEERGLTADDALLMARVARILRRPEYHRESQEIDLWHPSTPMRLNLASLSENPPPPAASPASSASGRPPRKAASPRRRATSRKPTAT